MDDPLPALSALRAFAETVRLESMTAAARALDMTQPAVSQRILQLEDCVGFALVERSKTGSRATAEGRVYYDNIADPLTRICEATRHLRQHAQARSRRREIHIAAPFGFAHHWLLPRLDDLSAAFESIDFRVTPVDTEPAGEADLTIRFTDFADASSSDVQLMNETVYPVCSPEFADKHRLADTLSEHDLDRLPLLHMDDSDPRWLDWSRWSRLAGFSHLRQVIGFQHNNYPLLINAAVEGCGLALAWHGLVDRPLAAGQLKALKPRVERPGFGYLLSAARPQSAGLQPIIDWLAYHA